MTQLKDYFNILGVASTANDEEIKKAYKRLAMKHHPDRGGNQERFQEIQEAYDTLTNPERRARWEHERQFGNRAGQANPGGFHFNFGFGPNIDDIIRQFHGGSPFGGFRAARNRDFRVAVDIDLASTLHKQTVHINVQQPGGSNKTVEVEIPRGVQTGMQMRCAGHGDHSVSNVPPGDLYVDFRVRPHTDFKIEGINLVRTRVVNCIDAILGSKIVVTGLDNKEFEINLPQATQHGSKFRIPEQGLWDVNQPVRGDLLIEISLHVPTVLTDEQLDRLQKLKS